jgi:outer membrane protease
MNTSMKTNRFLPLTMSLIALSILSPPQGAEANQVAGKKEAVVHKIGQENGLGFEARIGVGYLQGEANEFVYDTEENRTGSHLAWTLESMYMVGVGMTLRPATWFTINADVWTAVSEGSSVMDDWDWIYEDTEPRPEWDHWSQSENTPVTDGLIIDLNASIPFYKNPNLAMHAIVGYVRDNWRWESHGGPYIYPGPEGEFRGDVGTDPIDELGITYEQTFDTPYLGIGLGAKFNPVSINAKLIGSSLVSCETFDHHVDKKTRYYDDFSGGTMIGLTAEVVYDLTSFLSLGAAVNYTNYDTITGDSVMHDDEEGGEPESIPDAAGTSLERTLFTLSMNYRF